MKNLLLVLAATGLMLAATVSSRAAVVTFTAGDIKSAMASQGAPLSDASNQWGLWAVRARPIISGGSFTITGASTTQTGWGTSAPSTYSWNTYGTNTAWFFDDSGSEAWLASNPLYMIMDVPQDNFESYSFDGAGNWVGAYSPGGGGTFYASGYNSGVGGTNLVTAVGGSSIFSFDFTIDSGTWNGQWEFLVDGSKYDLGTYASPAVWQEDFFGDYSTGGGLAGNMGSGYAIPEPASLIIWGLLASGCAGVAVVRRRRRGVTGTPWSEENRQAIHQIIDRGRSNA